MRVRHIEVFYSVYRHKSISAAARTLNISQPALSKALRHAEDQFGFPLFTRTGRGLSPTNEAHRLYEDVKRVFEDIAHVKRTTLDLQQSGGGRLKVSTVTGLSYEILPRTIARVRKLRPDTSFEIQTLHYGDLILSLRAFETDIGLVFEAPIHDGLACIQAGEAEFACVYAENQLNHANDRIQIEELEGQDFITLNPEGPLGGKLNSALEGAAITIDPVVVAESCFVAKSLVMCGLGTTIVDEFTARSPGYLGLASRKLAPPVPININALYLEGRPLSGIGRQFLAALESELQEWQSIKRD